MIYTTLINIIVTIILFFTLGKSTCVRLKKAALAITAVSSLILIFITFTALVHGADIEALTKFGIKRTIQAIRKSPVNDYCAEDKEGSIIIYYRFGCSDCEAVFDDLSQLVSAHENIYWVASRQENGKKLLERYRVSQVPSGVIIQKNGDYTQVLLFRQDERGTVLDYESFERLLTLRRQLQSSQKTAANTIEISDNIFHFKSEQYFPLLEGKWTVAEYVGVAQDSHCDEAWEESYQKELEARTKEIIEENLGREFHIEKDNVTYFGPIVDLTFVMEDEEQLFANTRFSHLEFPMTPPYIGLSVGFVGDLEYYDFIVDADGTILVEIESRFFRLE